SPLIPVRLSSSLLVVSPRVIHSFPTRRSSDLFFAKLTGNDDDDGDDEDQPTFQVKDAESILDLCLAKGLSHRMLNWHYRSKHQRSEEHTSELQSHLNLVCRLLLEIKNCTDMYF